MSSAVHRAPNGAATVRTAGLPAAPLAAGSKKFCGIKWVSMVDQDWGVKGAHINLKNGREVRIMVINDGQIAGQAINVTAGLGTRAEIDASIAAIKASPALRADLIAKTTEAMNIMNTPVEKGGNWGMAKSRAPAEMARIIRAVKALG